MTPPPVASVRAERDAARDGLAQAKLVHLARHRQEVAQAKGARL
jgi:hypothetical protein